MINFFNFIKSTVGLITMKFDILQSKISKYSRPINIEITIFERANCGRLDFRIDYQLFLRFYLSKAGEMLVRPSVHEIRSTERTFGCILGPF